MTTRTLAAAMAALLGAALLASCTPTRGTVLTKYHDEAWTEFVPRTQCTSTRCTTRQVPVYHPECWGLVIDQDDSDSDRDRRVCVDVSTYSRLTVGDRYEEARR